MTAKFQAIKEAAKRGPKPKAVEPAPKPAEAVPEPPRAAPEPATASPPPQAKSKKKRHGPPRLPDGARFILGPYCAATQMWFGSLEVDGKIHVTSHSFLFTLLKKLDKMHRGTLTESPPCK